MKQRPCLDQYLDSSQFHQYYYLKEELVSFCRKNGLSVSGSKLELIDRISYFLDTGEVLQVSKRVKRQTSVEQISDNMVIEKCFTCTEKHREFFRKRIGEKFTFNVRFQEWLRGNSGKTYKEAIEAYFQIIEEKKKYKSIIDPKFEYNIYIRDFFSDNKGKTLQDAIKCWKYKKQHAGSHSYERKDLVALTTDNITFSRVNIKL